jgi:hypothetical protein
MILTEDAVVGNGSPTGPYPESRILPLGKVRDSVCGVESRQR